MNSIVLDNDLTVDEFYQLILLYIQKGASFEISSDLCGLLQEVVKAYNEKFFLQLLATTKWSTVEGFPLLMRFKYTFSDGGAL
jgi:hypothetical protein